MFTKILIANRGEIACRIIRTARRMGIATVAVFSEADRDALHVAMADEAVPIGPAPAALSYLDAAAILAACRSSGADAVHPGYGFLSERAVFAEMLGQAGIAFIGPNPHAIAAMGDKIESKRLARAAGVTTVPGHLDVIRDPDHAAAIAADIGLPVMIKASAGGGGKGMRVAHTAEEVRDGFVRARSEAAAAFGDDRVFLEKFIENPRHIEIQVLGDRHGTVVHLGERECSIQRRNQKVVEEAPSPLLDPETRAHMGAEAVALAEAVGYDSAGTVEFVVGQDKRFYFLEMNTRLQVEHPVTELVTGLDLVELMIRVAAGAPLPFGQADVRLDGWAVESRIYAEDPGRAFVPSIGRLTTYRPPEDRAADGITVRVDTGVSEGGDVSIHYDPMLAKLVTHGPSRAAAIAAQADALDAFAIEGIRHNIPFMAALMAHPRWQAGDLSTGFIEEAYPDGFVSPAPAAEIARRLAAVAGVIDHRVATRRRQISGQMPSRRPHRPAAERVVTVAEETFRFTVTGEGDDASVAFADGPTCRVASGWRPGHPVWQGTIDAVRVAIQVSPVLNGMRLRHAGHEVEARVYGAREAACVPLMPATAAARHGRSVLCPMPGLLRELRVAVGQAVKTGDPLAVVEAMKMEMVVRAERDGTVGAVHVEPGDVLAMEAPILDLL